MRTDNVLTFSVLPGPFAICRLPPDEAIPATPPQARLWSLSVTDEEVSLVLPEEHVLHGWKAERGWRCIKVDGPMEFDQTGILAAIAAPLSESGISIFVLSTFDTDYFLVRDTNLENTLKVLGDAGHRFKAWS